MLKALPFRRKTRGVQVGQRPSTTSQAMRQFSPVIDGAGYTTVLMGYAKESGHGVIEAWADTSHIFRGSRFLHRSCTQRMSARSTYIRMGGWMRILWQVPDDDRCIHDLRYHEDNLVFYISTGSSLLPRTPPCACLPMYLYFTMLNPLTEHAVCYVTDHLMYSPASPHQLRQAPSPSAPSS